MMASAALCSRLQSSPSVTIPLRALACRRDPAEPASGTHRGHQRRRLCVLGIGLRMAVRARARETGGVGGATRVSIHPAWANCPRATNWRDGFAREPGREAPCPLDPNWCSARSKSSPRGWADRGPANTAGASVPRALRHLRRHSANWHTGRSDRRIDRRSAIWSAMQ
jgi:hypothetical protein